MEEQNYSDYSERPSDPNKAVMSMGEWIVTLLVQLIPCVGIIMYFVWAFGSNGNENRRNFCRASLIFTALSIFLCIIMFAIFGAAIIAAMDSGYYY